MESILLVILIFYFLPAMMAVARNHQNRTAIFMLNLLLGWTILGWVAALVWSFTTNPQQAVSAGGGQQMRLNTETPKTCQYCMALNSRAFRHCSECGRPLPG